MTNDVHVTILMPTLNGAAHLEEALRSIATSKLAEVGVEVLVLDGGSTDATEAIARSFGSLVRFSSRRDRGMYDALNRGLAEARGEIIGWLNSDDSYRAEGPDALARAMLDDAELDLAFGDFYLVKEELGRAYPQHHVDDPFAGLRAGEPEPAMVMPLATFWRASTLRRLDGWDPSYRLIADSVLWVRAAAAEPPLRTLRLPVFVGSFRVHAQSLTTGAHDGTPLHREFLRGWDELLADDTLPRGVRAHLDARRRGTLLDLVWCALRLRRWSEAREWIHRLREVEPRWARKLVTRAGRGETRALAEKYLSVGVYSFLRSAYRTVKRDATGAIFGGRPETIAK